MARVEAVLHRLDSLRSRDTGVVVQCGALSDALCSYRDRMMEAFSQRTDAGGVDVDPLQGVRDQLREAYEGLVAALSAEPHEERVHRPINYARSVFHMGSALVCMLLTLVVFTPTQLPWAAAAFAGTAWTLELARRFSSRMNGILMAFFRPIAHPSEGHRVNSATWYMTSLVILATLHSQLLAIVALAVLGFADPLAGLAGRRFGRRELVNGRTLVGTMTFFAVGTVAAFAASWLVPAHPGPGVLLGVAAMASAFGAVAELFSGRVDDNLSIPVSTAAGAIVALLAFGLSPWTH